MKNVLLIILLFQFLPSIAQTYFWPVNNGLTNPKDGKKYYTITLKGKDSVQIYNAIIERITKGFTYPEKTIVSKKKFSYLKLYGMQPKAIGSYERSYNLTYSLEIDIENEKYRIYYSQIKISKRCYMCKRKEMILYIKPRNNFFRENGGYNKFLLNKKGKHAMGYKEEFYDLVKWTNHIAKTLDITNKLDKKDD